MEAYAGKAGDASCRGDDRFTRIISVVADLIVRVIFTRMLGSLKPGGSLIIQGYTPRQLDFNTGGPGKLAHLYDEALMLDAFGELDILDLRTYEAEITEGTGHQGMSGLLGLTARKTHR